MKGIRRLTGELVEDVEFFTQYVVPLPDPEKSDSKTQTVQTYVDTKTQVEEFLLAGRRLDESRGVRFDEDILGEGVEDAEVGLGKGADLVDVQRTASAAAARIQAKEAKAAAESDAKKAEQEKADFDAKVASAVEAVLEERAKASAGGKAL